MTGSRQVYQCSISVKRNLWFAYTVWADDRSPYKIMASWGPLAWTPLDGLMKFDDVFSKMDALGGLADFANETEGSHE